MHRLPFMHRAPTLGTTTARAGGPTKRRRVRRIDDVHDDAAGLEPIGIDGHWIVGLHAQRRGIDNDLVAVWIGWANAGIAARCRDDGVGEILSATLVDIEYGKRPGTRGPDSKCDSSAGAPGTDEKDRFVRRVIAFPLHPEHAAEAIEDGTDPASIVIATDHVERAHLPSSRM